MTLSSSSPKIAFVAASTESAQSMLHHLQARYPSVSLDESDIIVALGGDGFMLEVLHQQLNTSKAVFGMNCGSVGFLMNDASPEGLLERLHHARDLKLHPLKMTVTTIEGNTIEAFAINEVSLLRQTHQAAKVMVSVDGITRLEELVCDGVLLATPAGSTAYNLSAYGPILPIGANLLALTPISAFRPRRWRGALLGNHAQVTFRILEADKRPVSAVADFTEVRCVTEVHIAEDRSQAIHLLFDQEYHLEERILKEQFIT